MQAQGHDQAQSGRGVWWASPATRLLAPHPFRWRQPPRPTSARNGHVAMHSCGVLRPLHGGVVHSVRR